MQLRKHSRRCRKKNRNWMGRCPQSLAKKVQTFWKYPLAYPDAVKYAHTRSNTEKDCHRWYQLCGDPSSLVECCVILRICIAGCEGIFDSGSRVLEIMPLEGRALEMHKRNMEDYQKKKERSQAGLHGLVAAACSVIYKYAYMCVYICICPNQHGCRRMASQRRSGQTERRRNLMQKSGRYGACAAEAMRCICVDVPMGGRAELLWEQCYKAVQVDAFYLQVTHFTACGSAKVQRPDGQTVQPCL